MQVLHDAFQDDDGITVLTVHGSARGEPGPYMSENGYTYPVIYEGGSDLARSFGVTAFPTYVLVGPDGTILKRRTGTLNDAARDEWRAAALEARR